MTKKIQHIEVEIDKITNSIENATTGDSFPTDVLLINSIDLKTVTKKNGWQFDWKKEHQYPDRDVYKLTITGNPSIIQGLISLTEKEDHVYMHLIESAPFNLGKNKMYIGVPGNLIAYACKVSFHRGFEGYVSFVSKTALKNHYEKELGATSLGGNLMVIDTKAALKLVEKYFKNL